MDAKTFAEWGWRIPFWLSLILLVFSIYIRLKLHESPVFQKMKAEGKGSKSPLTDSFFKYPNNKYVLLALLGATAGQGVVWYTGQFYALFFLIITLKLDYVSAYALIGISLLIGTPFFIVFGWLSDRIGRLKIILAGCLIAAVTYFPLFQGLTHYVNPALEEFSSKHADHGRRAPDCQFHLFVGTVEQVLRLRPGQGLPDQAGPLVHARCRPCPARRSSRRSAPPRSRAGIRRRSRRRSRRRATRRADKAKINWFMTELILVIMVIYVTMVYGPIAAFLVELFPTKIRYTSMSLPYHIGNGWFGGMLPLTGDGDGGRDRRHLLRAVVSDRRRGHDACHRHDLPVRNQGIATSGPTITACCPDRATAREGARSNFKGPPRAGPFSTSPEAPSRRRRDASRACRRA